MAELLVIADDLTGALDSGVQLAQKGDRVLVSLDCADGLRHADAADVLVIDSESRHDTPDVAARKVADLARGARAKKIKHLYKKTDSGLRGNVGAELAAVLEALEADHLNFVPAYPKQQRTTEQGIHYVAGVPVGKSIFSVDPVNPVTASRVADLIHQQTAVPVTEWHDGAKREGIVVYDCATDDDMRAIAAHLEAHDSDAPMAGCAGLLEMLPAYAGKAACSTAGTLRSPQLVVVSGSANMVTGSQLDEAERRGAYRASLPLDRIVAGAWSEQEAQAFVEEALAAGASNPVILIDTLGMLLPTEALADGQAVARISEAAGQCAALASALSDRATMVVGGDALVRFISRVGATLLEPLDELFPGIVLARYEGPTTSGTMITKSGAFGDVGLFHEVYQALEERVGGEQTCR